jgi:hypothetical protein
MIMSGTKALLAVTGMAMTLSLALSGCASNSTSADPTTVPSGGAISSRTPAQTEDSPSPDAKDGSRGSPDPAATSADQKQPGASPGLDPVGAQHCDKADISREVFDAIGANVLLMAKVEENLRGCVYYLPETVGRNYLDASVADNGKQFFSSFPGTPVQLGDSAKWVQEDPSGAESSQYLFVLDGDRMITVHTNFERGLLPAGLERSKYEAIARKLLAMP